VASGGRKPGVQRLSQAKGWRVVWTGWSMRLPHTHSSVNSVNTEGIKKVCGMSKKRRYSRVGMEGSWEELKGGHGDRFRGQCVLFG
jgi:hypothetical protein